jgi:uncharacterized membrane protein
MMGISLETIMFREPFASAFFAAKQIVTVMFVINEKLMPVSEKKLATPRTDNRYLSPFLFAFITAEFESAYGTANRAFVKIFLYAMLRRKSFLFQYLVNTLP